MTTLELTLRKPLRLWPGVALALFLVLVRVVLPAVAPNAIIFGIPSGILAVLGGIAASAAILLWWLFFSRAPWVERIAAIVLIVVALLVTSQLVHPSIAGGMMGLMLPFFAIPLLSVALVAWAVAARRLSGAPRRAALIVTIVLACGVFTVLRTGGMTGEGDPDLHWRWTSTPEERLLAQAAESLPPESRGAAAAPAATPLETPAAAPAVKPADPAPPVATAPNAAKAPAKPGDAAVVDKPALRRAEWPGFRGPHRDGIVPGARIETDWASRPPVELWRRRIGPGWSSFAVAGDLIYTQEQRGEEEVVSCYSLKSGEPVWSHRDAVRFWESNAGPGPRATPTVSKGRVYTLGATGILNALNAGSGAVVWSRNAAADTKKQIPDWGLASSPLVLDDLVIVGVAGQLVAYDIDSGQPRWFGPEGGGGYSSPHLATIGGVRQVLLMRGSRTISVAPSDGTLLWEDNWQPAVAIVQPAVFDGGDVLIASGDAMGGNGLRRISVSRGSPGEGGPAGWIVQERWTSRGLKPYFNDFVVHKGHAFGFDGSIMACVDLQNGERKWKGGRYGHGQVLLLPEQDLLLVLSEEGEVALVRAAPDQFTEVARFKAIEGKTWNHPVLAGDILLVRNGEEMAAFRLPQPAKR